MESTFSRTCMFGRPTPLPKIKDLRFGRMVQIFIKEPSKFKSTYYFVQISEKCHIYDMKQSKKSQLHIAAPELKYGVIMTKVSINQT